ncbi:hypothetical protein NE237_006236 [Protea cynaroides]|uniref:Uncharacterized protein n=1 Tax=Protea cynaroides TaxID=273540 RepID=A0A9Q0QV88_9MAGN|nr:hypothetical protein NE237_006236 [Protea cynaroides]
MSDLELKVQPRSIRGTCYCRRPSTNDTRASHGVRITMDGIGPSGTVGRGSDSDSKERGPEGQEAPASSRGNDPSRLSKSICAKVDDSEFDAKVFRKNLTTARTATCSESNENLKNRSAILERCGIF